MPTSNEKEAVRLLIISNAWTQALLGAHYLNGSDGAIPGMANGLKGRNVELLEKDDWDNLAIHAAKWGKACKGRSGKSIKPIKAEIDSLKSYCEKNKADGLSPDQWPSFEDSGLYPRRHKGKGSTVYLGKDCRGKRHFDCISFVNWVLTTTLLKSYDYSIVQYEGEKDGGGVIAPVTVHEKPFPPLVNADILTKIKWEQDIDEDTGELEWKVDSQHIGFYMTGGSVIEASGSEVGVIISGYKSSDWTALCRLKDSYLKFGD